MKIFVHTISGFRKGIIQFQSIWCKSGEDYIALSEIGKFCFSTMSGGALDKVKDVDIDQSGRFKYILVEIEDEDGNKKNIVRGTARCNYHVEIYNEFLSSSPQFKSRSHVPGGGRIFHSPEEKVIHIYSESQQFGKADHKITKNLLQKYYSDYKIAITREQDEPFV